MPTTESTTEQAEKNHNRDRDRELVRAITVGFGAPRATAVLAVLGYRIVNFWLPLIPGAIAYIRLRLRRAPDGKTKPAPAT